MNSLLRPYQYLIRFFPPEFVTSLADEDYLYRLLVDEDSRLDELRSSIDECLELAYRYDLVDVDLEARLKKGDQESWQATINEIAVAKLLEDAFGLGCLRWHPQGRKKRVGEYELVLAQIDKSIFIEVKTVFARDYEKLEHRIIEKLYRYSEQVPIPSLLNIHIDTLGTSESISGRKFKEYLIKELSAIDFNRLSDENINIGEDNIRLPDYADNTTGLQLKIKILPIRPEEDLHNCHIRMIGGEARWVANEVYIMHSLRKAYEQLPSGKQSCLVTICSSTAFPLSEDEMLNALLEHLSIRVSLHNDKPVKEPETFRKPNGFFQPLRNRKVSAVALYKGRNIEKRLEIYHNPFALYPISDSVFMDMKDSIRQLVRTSDTEMKWLE